MFQTIKIRNDVIDIRIINAFLGEGANFGTIGTNP